MHSYTAVTICIGKYIRTDDTFELKGIRHYIDYSQASLMTMETSARMSRVILTCGVH